ncbi:MAG: glucose-1-phosphate adenylyltransferase subunit GlgD [Clostridium sp.]
MNNCLGIINLDENETRMGELVRYRPLASVPFAARYRIVDFVLSNMTNSGIECIGIFAKNKSRSLMDHLTNGRPWDLHRKKDGLKVFNFGEEDPAHNDIQSFSENIGFVKYSRKDYVLIAPSYMICNIDYNQVIKAHKKSRNDITMVYKEVINADKHYKECDVLNINEDGRVLSVGKNIGKYSNVKINMEMYIMRTELFIDIINDCVRSGMYRKVKQFIHSMLDELKVGTYEFNGYLACINSVKSYFDSSAQLLKKEINNELFNEERPIYTKPKDEAPTLYKEGSSVVNSIIANGCYIEGHVENCIISRRVYIAKDAKVKDCIIMQNSVIGDNSNLESVIADKGTEIKKEEQYVGSKQWPVVMKKREYF